MQRILDPARIEALAERQRTIPRLRFPDAAGVFRQRARRLRQLSEGSAIGPYLALMGVVCEAQQTALTTITGQTETPDASRATTAAAERIAQARTHGMPALAACGWPRDPRWLTALNQVCGTVAAREGFPDTVYAVCRRLLAEQPASLERAADRILAASSEGVDLEAAPFLMAALQVYWLHLTRSLVLAQPTAGARDSTAGVGSHAPGVCPVCGTVPLASIVRADGPFQGFRYLHCPLCATEWHLVRITCSHCLATEGIGYRFVEGSSQAVRAETCEGCRMYRKILYQETDTGVEPVADDLASLALDLLLTGEGYRRAAGNPLLWQPSGG